RAIDETKMIRLEQATVNLVVSNGYGGASVSLIAKQAGVAEGYLYRFYKGKQELVEALLHRQIDRIVSQLDVLLEKNTELHLVIDSLIEDYIAMATETPELLKFIYVLMNDYAFLVSDEQRAQIRKLIAQLIVSGQKSGQLGERVGEEEVFAMLISYPIDFLNMRLKNFFGKTGVLPNDAPRIAAFCKYSLSY
ncbi:MAG: hypothetical protein RIS47_125, partial [Bacteroidota bacterium]